MLDWNAWSMVAIFVLGYFFITIEHRTGINKATVALLMAIGLWALQFLDPHGSIQDNQKFLAEHLANVAQVVFFLLGAMTVVEIINAHNGFSLITNAIHTKSKRKLLWLIGILAFFLSAVIDNLTTTVVMVSLLRKLVPEGEERLYYGGATVIAANAGGAWTPIGDVTTTMLWIGGQVSTFNIMKALFLPSLVCLIAALLFIHRKVEGDFPPEAEETREQEAPLSRLVFYLGVAAMIFVPIFRALTGLPPFMGMLFALGALWLITDIAHQSGRGREHLRVPYVLSRIDLSGVLFFLGILLAIDALDSAKILEKLAHFLQNSIGSETLIAIAIGLVSAVVDNVPLVAATMGMYDLSSYPIDHRLWEMIAYAAGTGGSILLIGSAAGVVFAGMENPSFTWYLRRMSLPALAGFFAGMAVYLFQ